MIYTKEQLLYITKEHRNDRDLPTAVRQTALDMFVMCDTESEDSLIIRQALADLEIYGVFKWATGAGWKKDRAEKLKAEIKLLTGEEV